MSIWALIATLQFWLGLLVVGVILCVAGYSLWHCLTTPEQAFLSEGKRSRSFWAVLNGLALAISFLALAPSGPVGLFGALMILVIPGVYLADVRPAVSSYRRRGNPPDNRNSGYGQRPPTPW